MDKIMSDNFIDQYRVIDLKDIKDQQQLLYSFLEKRTNSHENTEFEESDADSRVYPDNVYDKARSVIAIFFPYLTSCHDFSGNISVYAQAQDYHIWGKDKLVKISRDLKEKFPLNNFYFQMDNGPLNERFFAYISGLGRKAINSMMINEKYGSYGFIGLIITDRELESNITEMKDCSRCMICMGKCPGGAINGDFTINSERCASYISQTKKDLTENQMNILKTSGNVFGCDICQQHCPDNSNKSMADTDDVITYCLDNTISKIEYENLVNMSNKDFKKYFGEKAFSWRGKRILLRNLDIIEGDHESFMIK